MKLFTTKKSTQELIGLGMALRTDKETMETRIRGIFSRKKSARSASIAAIVLVCALVIACFTTACHPVTAETAPVQTVAMSESKPATQSESKPADAQSASLLQFDGYAKGVVDGNKITVTDGKGAKHEFTWVDEGVGKYSNPIPEGTYASPADVALRTAEAAVTISCGKIPSSEIHINQYQDEGMDLVYYGIGFNGTAFETDGSAYGYADAVTGTLLLLDLDDWGVQAKQYGSETMNGKISSWNWEDERYAAAHTSEKALATATELIRTCFPTGEIIPQNPNVWDAGSHTDGEQIGWAGGYEAIVDAYIRMDKDPCYYVQVAVPLEDGAEPHITIFGCYPLGWEYCCNQIHDPAILQEELAEMEAIRNGRLNTDDGADAPVPTPTSVPGASDPAAFADLAETYMGQTFTPMAEDWKEGDSPEELSKIFLVRIGAYLDDGYESSEPTRDPKTVIAEAKRGSVLRFVWNDQVRYAIYIGDGQMVFANAEKDRMISCAYVADWLNDANGKPDCTCSILTWR